MGLTLTWGKDAIHIFNGTHSDDRSSGDPSDSFILKQGPFSAANWPLPSDFPDPVKSIKRNLGNDTSFRFQTKSELDKLLSIPNYDLPPFSERPTPGSFRNALEGWLSGQDTSFGLNHNGIHRWVGGTLGNVVVSFHDPLFQIHHSQVDRLFTMWQDLRGCSKGQGNAVCYRPGETDPDVNAGVAGVQQNTGPDGKPRFAIVGAMFNDAMFPWNIRVLDALVADQGYRYLQPNEVVPKPTGARAPGITGNKTNTAKVPKVKGNVKSAAWMAGVANESVWMAVCIVAASLLY